MSRRSVLASSSETFTLQCVSCGASAEVDANLRATTCPWCASPQVLEKPSCADRPRPAFALGFAVTREAALEAASRWLKRRRRWAPRAFARARVEGIRGVYVPAYVYSATAHARWSARVGVEYQVRSGKSRITQTEWTALQGDWSGYVRERVVSASCGLANADLERAEPFELGALHRYEGRVVSGWIAEDASLSPEDCLAEARREAAEEVAQRLREFMPGDSHADLRHELRLEQEDLALTLLPLWLLPLRWHPERPPVRVLVNGQTGRVGGKAPLSWLKIAAVVGLPLLALAVVFIVSKVLGAGQ